MGLLDRILNRRASADRRAAASVPAQVAPPPATNVVLLGGRHDLEVVGESQYQEALWRAAGGRTAERVRVEVQAVLLPEPDNPYDPNAITVLIDGAKVGYLCRDDAHAYRPGLLALGARYQALIALTGVVVGGGMRQDGPGLLGVWLSHDPADFGLTAIVPRHPRHSPDRCAPASPRRCSPTPRTTPTICRGCTDCPVTCTQRSASSGAFFSTIPIPSIAISCSANSRTAYTARVTPSHLHWPSTTTRAGSTMPKWRASGQRSSRSSARSPSLRHTGKWRSGSRKSRTGSRRAGG